MAAHRAGAGARLDLRHGAVRPRERPDRRHGARLGTWRSPAQFDSIAEFAGIGSTWTSR